uniref:VTT domain-containing protein n=1 Tax=Paulinella chromatophora TaxID=39717 RepID=B1X4E9_PAUCH|nr:hypothetical protein PCC_0377 [Paulinella chromatophora]ACB42818.1 hypothetical protein PCC_0377 [Paulinella chromatophora]
MHLYQFVDQISCFLKLPEGKLIFITIYALWVIFLLPGSAVTMASGFLYGPWTGTLLVFIGSSIGAEISFLLGRYFLQTWVNRRLIGQSKFQTIEKIISQGGLRLILLTRLSPIFPFSFLNMVYGVSRVSLRNYTIGLIGTLPGTFALCQFASVAHSLTELQNASDTGSNLSSLSVQILGFLSTAILIGVIGRSANDILSTSNKKL